jgi:Na+-transporting methylmalonyl-CoA/oxaloacetate decarboxylase gamma subunit
MFQWIAAATETATESKLAAMSIFSKGLVTTLVGLLGVFLVLTLFYVAIKLMQRSRKNDPDAKE